MLKWAETILAKIDKGSIPKEVSEKLFAGKQIDEDHSISNGFCIIEISQLPINGKASGDYDRMTIDLVFNELLK